MAFNLFKNTLANLHVERGVTRLLDTDIKRRVFLGSGRRICQSYLSSLVAWAEADSGAFKSRLLPNDWVGIVM